MSKTVGRELETFSICPEKVLISQYKKVSQDSRERGLWVVAESGGPIKEE